MARAPFRTWLNPLFYWTYGTFALMGGFVISIIFGYNSAKAGVFFEEGNQVEFIEDLKKIALHKDKIEPILSQFNALSLDSVLDTARIEKFCADNRLSVDDVKGIQRIFVFVVDHIIVSKTPTAKFHELIEKLTDIFQNDADAINSIQIVKQNLLNLNPFIIKRKELSLQKINNRLEEISITCDSRPVFNLDRSEIEKFLYPVILSIKEFGTKKKLTFEMTEELLEELLDEVKSSIAKIKILKSVSTNGPK